ncbi:MAG: DUF4854 domain-containing protein [Eubacterium sp.]|nr:DUF4854 domain-containing protein [Eubacterium sp.]
MSRRKIVSLILIAVLTVTSIAAVTSCKKEEKAPETLEEYIEQSESAKEELKEISDSMSNDLLDGTIEVQGNDMIMTLKYKETYEESYFSDMKKAMEDKLDEYRSSFSDALSNVEKESGISDIGLKLVVLNGDGAEIYKADLE